MVARSTTANKMESIPIKRWPRLTNNESDKDVKSEQNQDQKQKKKMSHLLMVTAISSNERDSADNTGAAAANYTTASKSCPRNKLSTVNTNGVLI